MSKFDQQLFDSFKLEPENIESIKTAINLTAYEEQDLSQFTTLTKADDDDPIAFLGNMEDVGKSGSGCDPTYEEKGIANSMKRWKMGDWQIPLKICYESMFGTIAQYAMKQGTDIADLSGTDIMAIYTMKLQEAIKSMRWRFAFLGDTEAQTVTEGGKITSGLDTDLFDTCDGLWKRIFNICTNSAKQLTEISANKKTSTSEQKAAMYADGYASGLLDTMLQDVDSRILDDKDSVLVMTRNLAMALEFDLRGQYKIILPWEKVENGMDTTMYNGIKIARCSVWDRQISAYEKGTTTVNLPYRAIFCNKKQLLVGSPENFVDQLDVWFDKKERRNYIYATGKMGTQTLEDDMIHAMY